MNISVRLVGRGLAPAGDYIHRWRREQAPALRKVFLFLKFKITQRIK